MNVTALAHPRDKCPCAVRFRLRLLLTAAVPALCASLALAEEPQSPPPEAASVVKLFSCKLPDVARRARCGVLYVPENPDRPAGRRLPVSVAVIPATGERTLPDPIVVLMGGPGEGAISAGSVYAQQFAPLRQDRDLLLVDQRGTGKSGALPCALYSAKDPAISLRDLFPVAAVKKCVQRLGARADLTQYTMDHFATDLEQVRTALGYGALNLFAGSYGTRAAQVFVRAYPKSVRTIYLGSAVPMNATNPLPFAKTAQTGIEKLFDACSADAACHAAFPSLREEFRDIMARLESGAVSVSIPDRMGTAPLSRGRVAEWIRLKLYRPKSASTLPWIIHRAHEQDWDPLVEELLSDAREADSSLSFGLFFSITCSEDVAYLREKDIVTETQGTYLGDYRVRQQQAACRPWPKVSLPKDYRMPVHSSVPTLFVTGDADGGTPLWYNEHVASGFSNRVEVVSRGQGHTEWSDCISQLYQRLVRSGVVTGLDSSCEAVPRPPFKTG